MRLPTYQDLDRLVDQPRLIRPLMNLWPPLWGSSIKILSWSTDFRRVRVRLRHNRITNNYLGTLYGASLFSMTDPWWVMMIGRTLGPDYQVWDKSAEIEFIAKGRESVYAEFHLTDEILEDILDKTADGEKHLRWFTTEITTADGTLIARVRKQVYVRKRPAK